MSFKSSPLPIGEVAARAGLRTSAVRYYERIGLLPPAERVGGKRRYDESVLERLAIVAAAQRAGLSLAETGELLRGADAGIPAGPQLQDLARRKLPEVEALIARAEAVRGWLQAAAECRCPTLDDCPLFDPTS